jgi:GNAT superfamily N-acetyltransferase
VLTAGDEITQPAGTTARRVQSVDELVTARRIQDEAFGGNADEVGLEEAEVDFATEGEIGSTFLAFVDGEPVAAGYASYTPLGLLLFGGATLPSARGRGAYKALVAARAREAADRGTPVLVTHAGQMSRPILERLGFKPVSRIERLLDVFPP